MLYVYIFKVYFLSLSIKVYLDIKQISTSASAQKVNTFFRTDRAKTK